MPQAATAAWVLLVLCIIGCATSQEQDMEGELKTSVPCANITTCWECNLQVYCGWCSTDFTRNGTCIKTVFDVATKVPVDPESCPSDYNFMTTCPSICKPSTSTSTLCGHDAPQNVCSQWNSSPTFNLEAYDQTYFEDQMNFWFLTADQSCPNDPQLYGAVPDKTIFCNLMACEEDKDCTFFNLPLCYSFCTKCKSEDECDEDVSKELVAPEGSDIPCRKSFWKDYSGSSTLRHGIWLILILLVFVM